MPVVTSAGHGSAQGPPGAAGYPSEAGIYLKREDDGGMRYEQLEPTLASQAKTGGVLASQLTFGIAKIKNKSVLGGDRSHTQINDGKPEFLFRFEVTNAGLSNQGGNMLTGQTQSLTNPSEFMLVQLEVKKGNREMITGQMNAYSVQSGTMDKFVRAFDFEKVEPGLYRVVPRDALAAGEYAFYYAGGSSQMGIGGAFMGQGGMRVFDFSVMP